MSADSNYLTVYVFQISPATLIVNIVRLVLINKLMVTVLFVEITVPFVQLMPALHALKDST